MTYEQIEKEFDENFLTKDKTDWKNNNLGDVTVSVGDVKSFLKQSFIKYLQSEVYACQQYKSFYNPIGDEFNKGKHQAMDDRIEFLQAQIKELEV